MKFEDAFNPTEQELREWAADPAAVFPEEMPQDWDLIVADWSRADLISELAEDDSCPNRDFFLAVLYLMAGDCVRTSSGNADMPFLRALLARIENTASVRMTIYRTRALELLQDPASFDYNLWCDGGYVYRERTS